jgi:GrpB-like predicted nucleotidyltransferase (UPF0157 family)
MDNSDQPPVTSEAVRFAAVETVFAEVAAQFEIEKVRLLGMLSGADIQHVGSTAIPGTITKGDLDINVRVSGSEFAKAIVILKKHYEVNQSHNWSETFASFKDDRRNLGIQLTVLGSEADDFITLRDLLLSRPDLVAQCNDLKRRHQGGSMEMYRQDKAELYERLRRSNDLH